MPRSPYETPEVEVLGSVQDLTRQNKIGPDPDAVVQPPIIVGSVVPVQP